MQKSSIASQKIFQSVNAVCNGPPCPYAVVRLISLWNTICPSWLTRHTTMMGLGQTVLLAGINLSSYIVPQSTAQIIAQPEAVIGFFTWCFSGFPAVLYGICAVIMLLYKPKAADE